MPQEHKDGAPTAARASASEYCDATFLLIGSIGHRTVQFGGQEIASPTMRQSLSAVHDWSKSDASTREQASASDDASTYLASGEPSTGSLTVRPPEQPPTSRQHITSAKIGDGRTARRHSLLSQGLGVETHGQDPAEEVAVEIAA